MGMIRVSQNKLTGQIIRRRVEVRETKSGYLWARQDGQAVEERFRRDPTTGVWRKHRSAEARTMSNYRVWLEEEKDGN